MARIALFIPPAAGIMNASYKLANELAAKGHTICYVGVPDCDVFVRSTGFAFKPLFHDWFPKGFFTAVAQRARLTGFHKLSQRRQTRAHMRRFFSALCQEERLNFAEVMNEVRPDLCLVASAYQDSTIWLLLLYELKLPCAYLNDTFMQPADKLAPPVWTSLVSDGKWLSQVRNRLAWRGLLWRKMLSEWISARLGLGLDWRKQFTKLAERCGYPVSMLNFEDMISPRLNFPELILWSPAFDFPGTERPGHFHVGPLIDLDRHQVTFPWERIVDGKKLIYCALGGMRFLKTVEYLKFYQAVVNAAASQPDWQWIVSVGDNVKPEDLHSVPSNVVIVKWAPQLQILERAHMMLTHGGANSVKECIWFGVPMIVFPIGLDHPGMAARVAYHGLGLVGNVRRVSATQLQVLAKKIDGCPQFRHRAALMAERFRTVDAQSVCATVASLITTESRD